MKNKILPVAISLCLLQSTTGLAALSSSDPKALEHAIQQLSEQTQQLQQQVASLQAELQKVKRERRHATKVTTVTRVVRGPVAVPAPGYVSPPLPVPPSTDQDAAIPGPDTQPPTAGVPGAPERLILTTAERANLKREQDINYLIGSTVLTSPVLNIRSAYDASDLVVNISNMNEDLRFLQQRQALEERLGPDYDIPSVFRPRIFISGKLEAQSFFQWPYQGDFTNGIDLAGAELDFLAEASNWAYGFISLGFDNGPLRSPLLLGSGNRINNSNIYLKRGFLTIGNLNKSPLYFTAGQTFVPFGDHTTYMLSDPVTKVEGRINSRAAILGYSSGGLYLSGFAYDGSITTGNSTVDEWGANAGYKFSFADGKFKGNIGAGFVNNIAEAQGYQLNGEGSSNSFQGFSQHSDTEFLHHKVDALNIHASGVMGPFSIYSEYVGALKSFDDEDLSFNDHGAAPKAFHVEGNYAFKIFDKPSAFTLAYDHTWQSLGLNLPEDSFIGVFNISIWKNTIEAIEFRHDENYSSSNSAGGICDPTGDGITTFCPVPSVGSSANQVLLQVGVYF